MGILTRMTRAPQFLDKFKQPVTLDRPTLINVAYTSLATKIHHDLAKKLAADVVDAVMTIRPPAPAAGVLDAFVALRLTDTRAR